MRKTGVSLIKKQYMNRKDLFLKDPNSDILVILNEKIFPLHREFLNGIGYFERPEFADEKVCMIESDLDEKWFQAVIGFYYGKQLQFLRNWELHKLFKVVHFLSATQLAKKFDADIKNNFDEYGFFLLVSLSYKYKIKWLKQKCEQQMILMGFQQLNYNRYDLFQVERQIFQQIIKLHELLKINQNIVGLREYELKRSISEYCKTNNINIEQINKLLTSHQCSSKEDLNVEEQTKNRKKSFSIPSNPNHGQQNIEINYSYQISKPKQNNQQTNYIQKIKLINSQMQQTSSKITEEINDVKNNLKMAQQQKKLNVNLQGIDEKLKKFQQLCKQQDKKYQNLKAQIQKLSPLVKDQGNKLQDSSGSTRSAQNQQVRTRGRKASQTLNKSQIPELPKLSRDFE